MTKEERLEYMRSRFPALKKLHAAGKSIVEAESLPKIDPEVVQAVEFQDELCGYKEYLREEKSERDILSTDEI